MKPIIFTVLFFFSALCSAQNKTAPAPSRFNLDGVPVSQVVRLIYTQALTTPFVLQPEVLQDMRPVTFRFESDKGDVRLFLTRFLSSLGYEIESRSGVDYVRPIVKTDAIDADRDVFVYRPKYRDGSFLMDLLSPVLRGSFTSKRVVQAAVGAKSPTESVPAQTAAAQIDRNSDVIVYQGTPADISILKKLLDEVDVPTGELLVKAVVYEVQTGKSDGTSFGLAASILGGKLGLNVGAVKPLANSITIGSGNFQAVFSALAADNRFKVMSSPSLRVKSGKNARFTVGQDVPVLGSVSYPQGSSQPVQSVEYRSSGVILDLTPNIRDGFIDLDLTQQLSNFVNTSTGVNNSPTLIKRELKTTVSAKDGDLIIIGGLSEDKQTDSHSGLSFLPSLFHTRSTDDAKTELLLVMQINKI